APSPRPATLPLHDALPIYLFVNAIELDASLIQPLHERGRLGRDRGDQPRERQDHDRYDDEQARRGRKRAPRREALLEPRVERINDDPERDGPEHRLQEAADQPQEGDRYENQERREERALHIGCRHSLPSLSDTADRLTLSHQFMRSPSVFSNPCRLGAYHDAPRSRSGRYSWPAANPPSSWSYR